MCVGRMSIKPVPQDLASLQADLYSHGKNAAML